MTLLHSHPTLSSSFRELFLWTLEHVFGLLHFLWLAVQSGCNLSLEASRKIHPPDPRGRILSTDPSRRRCSEEVPPARPGHSWKSLLSKGIFTLGSLCFLKLKFSDHVRKPNLTATKSWQILVDMSDFSNPVPLYTCSGWKGWFAYHLKSSIVSMCLFEKFWCLCQKLMSSDGIQPGKTLLQHPTWSIWLWLWRKAGDRL